MFYLQGHLKSVLYIYIYSHGETAGLLQLLKANTVQTEMIVFYHDDQHKIQVLVFDKVHRIYNYYLDRHIYPRRI